MKCKYCNKVGYQSTPDDLIAICKLNHVQLSDTMYDKNAPSWCPRMEGKDMRCGECGNTEFSYRPGGGIDLCNECGGDKMEVKCGVCGRMYPEREAKSSDIELVYYAEDRDEHNRLENMRLCEFCSDGLLEFLKIDYTERELQDITKKLKDTWKEKDNKVGLIWYFENGSGREQIATHACKIEEIRATIDILLRGDNVIGVVGQKHVKHLVERAEKEFKELTILASGWHSK